VPAVTILAPPRRSMVGVAQLVEHWVVVPGVAGSSPVTHPTHQRRSGPVFGPDRNPVEGPVTKIMGQSWGIPSGPRRRQPVCDGTIRPRPARTLALPEPRSAARAAGGAPRTAIQTADAGPARSTPRRRRKPSSPRRRRTSIADSGSIPAAATCRSASGGTGGWWPASYGRRRLPATRFGFAGTSSRRSPRCRSSRSLHSLCGAGSRGCRPLAWPRADLEGRGRSVFGCALQAEGCI
jgi:hypothetical protein